MRKMLVGVLTVAAALFMLSVPTVIAQGLTGDCYGNFDCDQDVDAIDVDNFLSSFGRSQFFNPCPLCQDSPCPCSSTVPKTGQTTSYATGDDGDLEKGLIWPNPRFTDNLDGTITDNLTRLIWLKDATCLGTRTWSNALSDCNGLADGQCDLADGSSSGDWRLPNLREIISLIDFAKHEPALPSGHLFTNVETDWSYWTSTMVAGTGGSSAWRVQLNNRGSTSTSSLNSVWYTWPVRGGH